MKEFLKQKLLENRSGIYSLIAHHYADRIDEMGCSLFRDWLSEELSVEKSTINLTSLYSASRREQKKYKRKSKMTGSQPVFVNKQNSDNSGSNFSDPGAMPSSTDNITEM
jgi:heme oxygenase